MERRVPAEELQVGDRSSFGPARSCRRTARRGRALRDRQVAADRARACRSRSAPGDAVIGATVNVGGRLVVRATRVGADTALAQIARLVTEAQSGKAAAQRLADRVSGVFVPIVIVIAVATLAFWLGAGGGRRVRVRGGGRGADHRLPVRARARDADRSPRRHRPRRAARHPDQGAGGARVDAPGGHDPARQDRHRHDREDDARRRRRSPPGVDRAEALRLVGSLEHASEHPVGRAIAAAAAAEGRRSRQPESFKNREGLGVEGIVDGHAVRRRSRRRCSRSGARAAAGAGRGTPPRRGRRARPPSRPAGTARAQALFVVSDQVKPTSREAIARLRALGLRPILLTGDNEPTARAVARRGRDRAK